VSPETLRQAKFNNLSPDVTLPLWRVLHGQTLLHLTDYAPSCWDRALAPPDGAVCSGLERAWRTRRSDAAAALFVRAHLLQWGLLDAAVATPRDPAHAIAAAQHYGPARETPTARFLFRLAHGASLSSSSSSSPTSTGEGEFDDDCEPGQGAAGEPLSPFIAFLAPSGEELFASVGSRCLLLAVGWMLARNSSCSAFDRYLALLEHDVHVRFSLPNNYFFTYNVR